MTTGAIEWATQAGDVWTRRWRETDAGLADLGIKLDAALLEAAPGGPFRGLDIGCGAGTTSARLARSRPDAAIIACDISPSLAALARDRLAALDTVRVLHGDAAEVASREGPFDLIFSRHGVMFFTDPVSAFRGFREGAGPGATLVFSCFQDWRANAWASELSEAVAGRHLRPPGREPNGFAFAEPAYVEQILQSAGWVDAEAMAVSFRYVAGEGTLARDAALDFLAEIGPASRTLLALPGQERDAALERMRGVIEQHREGDSVAFPAAAWIWRARAGPRLAPGA